MLFNEVRYLFITDEFVIHGTDNEYDYDYVSNDRTLNIGIINNAYYDIKKKKCNKMYKKNRLIKYTFRIMFIFSYSQ